MTEVEPELPAAAAKSRSRLRRILLGVVFPLVFAALLGVFLYRQRAQLEPLTEAPMSEVALIAVLVLVGHFLNSLEFWYLYRSDGARCGVIEYWFLYLAGQLGNYLPAQAGTIYRLRYMRVVHEVSYGRSAAVYGADFVATLAGAAGAALVGVLGAAIFTDQGLAVGIFLTALGFAALAVAMAVIPLPRFAERSGRLARAWRSFHDGFDAIRRDPKRGWVVVGIEVVKYIVTAWRFQVAFRLLGIHEPFWTFLVIAPAAGIASFISITPGAFGFREVLVTAAAVGMGVHFNIGLLAATVDRAVMLASAITLGSLGFAVTYPRLRAATAAPGRAPDTVPQL